MKTLILSCILLPLTFLAQSVSLKHNLRVLNLGDSYTIGQSVAVTERWPVQLSDSLIQLGVVTDTMRIIATTGWRTDDLINAIKGQNLEAQHYNLVSLLIGVNNQFQGKPFSQYISEFPALLDSAVRFAGGDKSHVFVVSIPDYAYTPFGQQSSNPSAISSELDMYNAYSKHVADSVGITYINITPISRQGLAMPSYVASDGLHPSGVQYSQWVQLMMNSMHPEILTGIATQKTDELGLTIFPNPAKDFISIALGYGASSQNEVLIYNATGAVVLKENFAGKTFQINTSELAKGLYTVKVSNAKNSSVQKMVIQ